MSIKESDKSFKPLNTKIRTAVASIKEITSILVAAVSVIVFVCVIMHFLINTPKEENFVQIMSLLSLLSFIAGMAAKYLWESSKK